MSELAAHQFYDIKPPRVSGKNIVQSTATGLAAASFDWVGGLAGNAPTGKVFLTLESNTRDTYVRFGPTATTATTTSNGLLIKADQPGRVFLVDPIEDRFIDSIALVGAGVLKVHVSSAEGMRRTI